MANGEDTLKQENLIGYAGIIISIIGVAFTVGIINQGITNLHKSMDKFDERLNKIEGKINELTIELRVLDRRMGLSEIKGKQP